MVPVTVRRLSPAVSASLVVEIRRINQKILLVETLKGPLPQKENQPLKANQLIARVNHFGVQVAVNAMVAKIFR